VSRLVPEQVRMRYHSLDSLRFVAACGVMLFHYQDYLPWLSGPRTGLSRNAYLMVDFFFILSGFVIHQTYSARMASVGDYFVYLRRRLARIYPLHLATFLFMAGMGVVIAFSGVDVHHMARFRLSAVLPNLLLLHAWGVEGWSSSTLSFNGPSWSISAEFGVYLIFPLLLMMQRRVQPWLWFAFAGCLIFLNMRLRELLGLDGWTLATWDFGVIRAIPSFVFGMGISALVQRRVVRVRSSIAYCTMAVLVIMMQAGVDDTYIVLMFVPVIWLAANADATGSLALLKRPSFVRLGEASYSVYMLHQCVALVILQMCRKLFGPAPVAMTIAVVVCLVFTTALSLWVYAHFELPARLRLSGRRPANSVEKLAEV